MKWKNKGHEFDGLGEQIKNISAIYLFGAGVHGKTAFEKYNHKINIKGFIDNDQNKQGNKFCGLSVIAPKEVQLACGEGIVITIKPSSTETVKAQLETLGITDVFLMQVFFPILDAYKFEEICIPSISFLPTTVCNLKCKHCLNFSPYVKKHQVRPLRQLTNDLDLLFSNIDSLLLLHISGGEPFTYPHIAELINYIAKNFKEKLGRLEMTTNGTVIPSERLLESIKSANLQVILDDYRKSIPVQFNKHDEIVNLFNEYGIDFRIQNVDSWIDLAPFTEPDSAKNEEELRRRFDTCAVPWQEYRDGKLWLCNYAAYAEIAEIQSTGIGESFDLTAMTSDRIREAVEFRLGYSEKGYADFCKRCSGYNNNSNLVMVAEQLQ